MTFEPRRNFRAARGSPKIRGRSEFVPVSTCSKKGFSGNSMGTRPMRWLERRDAVRGQEHSQEQSCRWRVLRPWVAWRRRTSHGATVVSGTVIGFCCSMIRDIVSCGKTARSLRSRVRKEALRSMR